MEMDKTIKDADGNNVNVSVLEYQEDAFIVQLFTPGTHLALTPAGARLLVAALSEAATMAETTGRNLTAMIRFRQSRFHHRVPQNFGETTAMEIRGRSDD